MRTAGADQANQADDHTKALGSQSNSPLAIQDRCFGWMWLIWTHSCRPAIQHHLAIRFSSGKDATDDIAVGNVDIIINPLCCGRYRRYLM